MALETKVKVGGAWKLLTEPKVKVAGDWKVVEQIQVKVAGVGWKTVFEVAGNPLNATNQVHLQSVSGGNCHSGISYRPDGDLYEIYTIDPLKAYRLLGLDDDGNDHTGEWYDGSPTGSLWEVRTVSMVTGSWTLAPAGVGAWIDLSAMRDYYVRRLGGKGYTPGTTTCTANMAIREKADTSNIVTFTVKATAIQT